VAGSYLALRTFFGYKTVSSILSSESLYLVCALLSIITLYFIREGITSVYYINFMLYLPEAFSFSDMKWDINYGHDLSEKLSLNGFKTPMSFNESIVIGLALMAGYILLLLISMLKETNRELALRGERSQVITNIISQHFKLICIFIILIFIITIGISISVNALSYYINQFI
jgi:hypothetical protein